VTTGADQAKPPEQLNILVCPGSKELFGSPADLEEVAETLRRLNREETVALSIGVLNTLAYDRKTGFGNDQATLIEWLPEEARVRCAKTTDLGAPVRPFHPLQQLALVHFASRYCPATGGVSANTPEGREAWAIASIQINDLLPATPPPANATESERNLYRFAAFVAGWELINPPAAQDALCRLLCLMNEAPLRGPQYSEAAERLKERFRSQLGLEFQWAYDLTAFLMYWWEFNAEKIPTNPGAGLVDLRRWLAGAQVPGDVLDAYLRAVATRIEEIPAVFDELRAADNPLETIPFRRKPLLRIDDYRLIAISPFLVSEKGGIDLFWLLSNDPGGAKERRLWTDDFGLLHEAYVHLVLDSLGAVRLGGRHVADLPWSFDKRQHGQIDSLVFSDKTLVVLEVKGSLISQRAKSSASWDRLRPELERKLISGDDDRRRKGISQLARSIIWLNSLRKAGGSIKGINIENVQRVLPVLVVADHGVRFPGLGRWFEEKMRAMLPASLSKDWHVGTLTICGIEDLENIEHGALTGGSSLVQVFEKYDSESNRGAKPLWQVYGSRKGPHPRLERIFDAWIERLRRERVLPDSSSTS
jgi:hypothetical protein